MNYANAVLQNWYTAGLKTPEDVEAAEAQRAANRPKDVPSGTSFSTDSFFDAAIGNVPFGQFKGQTVHVRGRGDDNRPR